MLYPAFRCLSARHDRAAILARVVGLLALLPLLVVVATYAALTVAVVAGVRQAWARRHTFAPHVASRPCPATMTYRRTA